MSRREDRLEGYVCPQCGPDARGAMRHAWHAHSFAGMMGQAFPGDDEGPSSTPLSRLLDTASTLADEVLPAAVNIVAPARALAPGGELEELSPGQVDRFREVREAALLEDLALRELAFRHGRPGDSLGGQATDPPSPAEPDAQPG